MIAKWCCTRWKRNYEYIALVYLDFYYQPFLDDKLQTTCHMQQTNEELNVCANWSYFRFHLKIRSHQFFLKFYFHLFSIIIPIIYLFFIDNTYRRGFGRTILWLTLVIQTGLNAPAKCSTPAILVNLLLNTIYFDWWLWNIWFCYNRQ